MQSSKPQEVSVVEQPVREESMTVLNEAPAQSVKTANAGSQTEETECQQCLVLAEQVTHLQK